MTSVLEIKFFTVLFQMINVQQDVLVRFFRTLLALLIIAFVCTRL